MKRWIVEEDSYLCTHTLYYTVKAETREEAIRMVADGDADMSQPFDSRLFYHPEGVREYKDTHEATDEEWRDARATD